METKKDKTPIKVCSPDLKSATKEEKDVFVKILDRVIEEYEEDSVDETIEE